MGGVYRRPSELSCARSLSKNSASTGCVSSAETSSGLTQRAHLLDEAISHVEHLQLGLAGRAGWHERALARA